MVLIDFATYLPHLAVYLKSGVSPSLPFASRLSRWYDGSRAVRQERHKRGETREPLHSYRRSVRAAPIRLRVRVPRCQLRPQSSTITTHPRLHRKWQASCPLSAAHILTCSYPPRDSVHPLLRKSYTVRSGHVGHTWRQPAALDGVTGIQRVNLPTARRVPERPVSASAATHAVS